MPQCYSLHFVNALEALSSVLNSDKSAGQSSGNEEVCSQSQTPQ